MRQALVERLKQRTQIQTWRQGYNGSASIAKPFGVIVFGAAAPGMAVLESHLSFTVWPYVDRELYDFVMVDRIVAEIQAALLAPMVASSGKVFEAEWMGEGSDYNDDAWQALTRPVYFRIPIIGR